MQNVADMVEALPIVEIIGVSLHCVYAGCWCGRLFRQGHQVVLPVPRLLDGMPFLVPIVARCCVPFDLLRLVLNGDAARLGRLRLGQIQR